MKREEGIERAYSLHSMCTEIHALGMSIFSVKLTVDQMSVHRYH